MKVLLIEDNQEVVDSLCLCLKLVWPQLNIITTAEATKGIDLVETESPDIVLLSLELPDMDGFDVLAQIRSFSDVPIIVLSIRQAEMDKVKALETGADDFITKPFSPLDLLARVKAALRRAGVPQPKQSDATVFTTGDLTINFASREVFVSGNPVKLTPIEYVLLCNLVRNEGRVMSHRSLLEKTWGANYTDDIGFLKKYIYRLRLKLSDDNPSQRKLVTVRGMGYKFVATD